MLIWKSSTEQSDSAALLLETTVVSSDCWSKNLGSWDPGIRSSLNVDDPDTSFKKITANPAAGSTDFSTVT